MKPQAERLLDQAAAASKVIHHALFQLPMFEWEWIWAPPRW